MDSGYMVPSEGLPSPTGVTIQQAFAQLMTILECQPERWRAMMRCVDTVACYDTKIRAWEEKLKTLEGQNELLLRLLKQSCCTANMNFSQLTIDDFSDDGQVNLELPVAGLGGDYVDNFPVPPNKRIRLKQVSRPGWTPKEIRIDLNLANNAVNYLDIQVQFYLSPDQDGKVQGKNIGSLLKANQFLNKDGTQITVQFPKYKNEPINIGSLETLTVELFNKGGNNIDSAQVVVFYDNECFYEWCKQACASTCKTC